MIDHLCRDLAQRLGACRREAGRRSIAAFARLYLRHHFSLPPCPMHTEMFELLEEATEKRGQKTAIAAPRGYAKSTVFSTSYVLWCICYDLEQFIVCSPTRPNRPAITSRR